jgi:adenylate kinase
LRRAVREGTPLGAKVKALMDRGELVPDALLLDLVRETLEARPAPEGWVLDGYPRNLAQAESLDEMLAQIGIRLGGVLNLEVADGVLVTRLAKRAALENRTDDSEETVRNRLRVYERQTEPLVDHYAGRGTLRRIDGEGTVEEVQARVRRACASPGGPA